MMKTPKPVEKRLWNVKFQRMNPRMAGSEVNQFNVFSSGSKK